MNDFQQVAEELARRIGETTARYEAELAMVRVENNSLNAKVAQVESLIQRCSDLEKDLADARAGFDADEPQLDKPASD